MNLPSSPALRFGTAFLEVFLVRSGHFRVIICMWYNHQSTTSMSWLFIDQARIRPPNLAQSSTESTSTSRRLSLIHARTAYRCLCGTPSPFSTTRDANMVLGSTMRGVSGLYSCPAQAKVNRGSAVDVPAMDAGPARDRSHATCRTLAAQYPPQTYTLWIPSPDRSYHPTRRAITIITERTGDRS